MYFVIFSIKVTFHSYCNSKRNTLIIKTLRGRSITNDASSLLRKLKSHYLEILDDATGNHK